MEEILKNPTLIWFVVGLVMFLLEMAGPGLVILFFGVGAWVVMLLTLFTDMALNTQLAIFLIASIVSLALFRNVLKKAFHGYQQDPQDLGKNLDEFVGHKATVIKKIFPNIGGKVEFKGSQWDATASDEIEEGQAVEIIATDNLTLIVKKLS